MVQENRAVALRTVAMAIGGVIAFVLAVYALTGRFSDGPPSYRRAQVSGGNSALTWFRLDVPTRGRPAPVFLGVSEKRSLLINGSEELRVKAEISKDEIRVDFPQHDTVMTLTRDGQKVTGTWTGSLTPPQKITGKVVPDPLPERRYPETPDRPDAKGEMADFSHVWLVDIGGQRGKAVFHQTDTGVLTGAFITPHDSTGMLTGRVFGRLAMLSRFDGGEAAALTLIMNPDGTTFGGTLAVGMSAPRPIKGRQADRVPLPVPIRTFEAGARPRWEGPKPESPSSDEPSSQKAAVVVVLDLTDSRAHELADAFVDRVDDWKGRGLEVTALGFVPRGGKARADGMLRGLTDHLGIAWHPIALGDATPDAVRQLAPGAFQQIQLPSVLFIDGSGAITAQLTGFWGRAATHNHYQLMEALDAAATNLIGTP